MKALVLALTVSLGASLALAQSAPQAKPTRGERAMQHLKAADTDADGLLSRSEAEKSMPHLAQNFDALDTNKDGKLSAEELRAGHEKRRDARKHRPSKDGAHGPFGMADSNHDGIISREEIQSFSKEKPNADRLMQAYDMADANKDGQLTQAERDAHKQSRQSKKHRDAPPAGPTK